MLGGPKSEEGKAGKVDGANVLRPVKSGESFTKVR